MGKFKNNLFSKKDNDKDLIKNAFEDIISKENIDSYIAELDSAKNKLENMFDWDRKIKNNKAAWQDYFDTLDDGEDYIKDLIKNTDDLSKLTGRDLVNACDEARKASIAHNEEIKNMSFPAKSGKAAMQAPATVGNMIAFTLISKGISLAVKGIDNLIHLAEHCEERVDELMSSYQSVLSEANSNAQTLEELAGKYETLSKGVNNLGENVSLTTDEYAEYNKIVNQIADMFPNLIQGYTGEGNAILSLKSNAEELRDAYKGAQQEAYNMLLVSGKNSDGNDIIKDFKNVWGSKSFFNDIFKGSLSAKEHADIITDLYNAMLESDDAYEKLYKYMVKGTGLWDNYHLTG